MIFDSPDDPDYQFILGQLQHAAGYMNTNKRWHMDGFRPNDEYIREMKRYGILPETFDVNSDPVDVYELDRKYWESFWHYPPGEEPERYDNQAFRDQLTADANERPSKKVVWKTALTQQMIGKGHGIFLVETPQESVKVLGE